MSLGGMKSTLNHSIDATYKYDPMETPTEEKTNEEDQIYETVMMEEETTNNGQVGGHMFFDHPDFAISNSAPGFRIA